MLYPAVYRGLLPSYNKTIPTVCPECGQRLEFPEKEKSAAAFQTMKLKHMNPIRKIAEIRRALAAALLFALILPGTVGCTQAPQRTGQAAIEHFLSCIAAKDYAGAYALLSASVRNDGEAPKSKRVTEKEFTDKYTNIFDALGITAIEYSNLSVTKGEILCKATFDAVYASEVAGNMENSFSVLAIREGGEWCIEWSPALIFPEMEWGDTVRVGTLSAERGEILADGTLLAATVGTISVYAAPSKVEDEALFIAQVSPLLGMTEEEITKALKKEYNDVAVLKQYYSDELSDSAAEQLLLVPGVGIDYGNYGVQREYPYGSLLAHLIGYVGAVPSSSKEELAAELDALNAGRTEQDGLYTVDSIVGRLGLEKQYEQELRGKDGKLIYIRTAEGTNRRTLYRLDPEDGYDLELTIDTKLQQRLEEVMELVLFGDTTAGAVVVMNPLTGAVQAMSSYPSYDLNLFTRGISQKDYSALLNDPAKPLINRATQGLYPPGSTMKAFTGAAALDLGVLDPEYAFDDSQIEDDYWTPTEYGAWIWTPIKRTHVKYPIGGPLNMRKAFIHSDNIYFANAALLIGWEAFEDYMENIGFTERIPFDIGVAQPQLVNEDTEMNYKLLADSGYGQGEILVTPLQLASMFSALANNGNIAVPYVVEGVYRENGIKYEVVERHETSLWKENVISAAAIETITPMLKDVVDKELNGTGRQLRVKSCVVAAKTGTAEIGNDKSREISWFVGYRTGVSDEDARLVLVMLEIPAETKYTTLKFDIARTMLELDT